MYFLLLPFSNLSIHFRTIEAVKRGEELTIHYRMDMEGSPDWYQDEWDRHGLRLVRDKEIN